MLKGIAASNGIGLAKSLVVVEKAIEVNKNTIEKEDTDSELERFNKAIADSHKQLDSLYESTKQRLGSDAEIIQAQISMLNDPVISEEVQDGIINRFMNAEHAVAVVLDEQIDILSAIDDEYIRERATDLIDIKNRLLSTLTGNFLELSMDEESIIVCDTLTPSQTANFDPQYVKGIICESGGIASHAAIIARNLEIPAIMGCKSSTDIFKSGDLVFIDGSKGQAYMVTDENEIKQLQKDIEKAASVKAELLAVKDIPSATTDGKKVILSANVGAVEEVKLVTKYGGEGIGLFRTEFFYMEGKSLPDEDAQFAVYKKTVELLSGEKAVFRTFDIGGDKEVPSFKIPKEDNPFLGWRAVRICLDEVALFKIQLRAMLRASAFGSLKIMIPMISAITELSAVRKIFEKAKEELRQEGVAFDEQTELGIMIEIPSAAICASSLIKEADFFSIGTNDLIQYTLAVDRGNEKVSGYYDFFNPAVLRLVKMTIDASHKAGKTTGMCGEAAGDPIAALLLLGLGLDSFSMSPSILPKIKKIITHVDMKFAEDVARTAMEMETGEEIKQFLTNKLKEIGLDYLILL